MAFGIMTIVHGVLALFVIIELGLTGYIVSKTSSSWFGFHTDSPSQFSFMLFNSIWSILALLYLAIIPIVFSRLYHGLVALIVLAISTLFWFAGSIALAVYIGVPSCDGNNFCQSAQAAVAFGFFIWATFTGMTIMEALSFFKGGARVDGSRKPGQTYPGV